MSKQITEISEGNTVEAIRDKQQVLEAYSSENCIEESGSKRREETCSMQKETKGSKKTTGKTPELSQQNGSAGHQSSLVKWLQSSTPQKKASPSEDQKQSNVENATKEQKNIQGNARASVKNDASRIKTRVRYLLKRINQEQNLIDAYASDGLKGQSHEKIRPEQELKRAETQIIQCKLGIRKELEQLHTLSLEGSIQEGAFDEEGQIYFDDIFCAICKSKEVFPENDIILCDGACDRGFHQFCLDPPLQTEDIPPGDDSWLCPVCDCKIECLDAINDRLETDFDIEDSWEKVFAEVEEDAYSGGNLVTSQVDWPSEDDEDDDYNPEKLIQNGSARENGISDDGNSDSDSDSSAGSDSNSTGSSEVVFFDEFAGKSRGKKRSHSEEETELSDEDIVSQKRQRADVDYKQLYDEAYGPNASDYDSSEDDDWEKKIGTKDETESDQENKGVPSEIMQGNAKNVETTHPKKNSVRPSKEMVLKLQEVFKECELPSKVRKQELSCELGLSFEDVNAWFRNSRRNAARKKKSSSKLETCMNAGSGKD